MTKYISHQYLSDLAKKRIIIFPLVTGVIIILGVAIVLYVQVSSQPSANITNATRLAHPVQTYVEAPPPPVNDLIATIVKVSPVALTVQVTGKQVATYVLADSLEIYLLTPKAPTKTDLAALKPGVKADVILDSSGKTVEKIFIIK
ncbi:MAG: hypothetical protein M1609_06220 [Firmicutes bacterium]|nr:hypothetical protein [Bacillota bacterium]